MKDRLHPRKVAVEDTKIKLLLYGLPGSGKTTMAATAQDHPVLAPVLFLSFEAGLLSIAERGDIDYVGIESMEDVEEIFEALRGGINGFAKYNTIVIDSGSELYTRALLEATASSTARDNSRGRERTLDDVQLEDYGRASRQTYRIFRAMRDLPLNLIVTAHAKFNYAQGADRRSSEPVEVVPAFSGQLATQLMGIFDFVHYLYVADDERYLLTRETGAYKAKTRGFTFADRLGQVVTHPNLPDLYNLLLESSQATSHGGKPEHVQMGQLDIHQEEVLTIEEEREQIEQGIEPGIPDEIELRDSNGELIRF